MRFVMIELTGHALGSEIKLSAEYLGNGLQITCTGGERPHIGAVSVATPYDVIGQPAASVSTISVPKHHDDVFSEILARMVCKEMQITVVVISGIHYDVLVNTECDEIKDIVMQLGGELLEQLVNEEEDKV